MPTEKKAKPASKKAFTKADVKSLYREMENPWRREHALALAFAASGSYKVYKPGRGYLDTGYTQQFWPMELAIDNGDLELLEAFRPHVDVLREDEELGGSWLGKAWRSDRTQVAALFMSWHPDMRDDEGKWLRIAAANRSMALIELALPISNPLGKDEDGETPLMAAAGAMCVEAVERLLPLSDPNAVDGKGRDALMHALEGLLRRADPGPFQSHYGPQKEVLTCFQSLIQKSEYSAPGRSWKSLPAQFAEMLLAAGAEADEDEAGGESMLMKAINAGDKRLFDQLLPSSKLGQADGEGFTPLLKAARLGRSDMVAALAPLSDCDRQGADGSTALMLAAQRGDLASVRLLSGRSNRALRDAQGRTAAMVAAEKLVGKNAGKDEMLVFLRLFDPASAKGQGILPWLVGIPELFEAALPFCDPDDKAANGQPALHRAIELGEAGAFERLLPVSDAKAADADGKTPLMLSIQERAMGMFQALLPVSEAKAMDIKGKTALMLAADGSDLETVKALLPVSNVKAADHEGLTALMIAAMGDHVEIAAALMPASDADAVDQDGKTALAHAVGSWRHNGEMISFLAERTDLSKIGEAGRASLEAAMEDQSFPEDAAEKLRGMMRARSERDELLSVMAEPKKPSGPRSNDAFYAAPKKKKASKP
jgi:ankyrin repeat protein